MGKNKGNRSGKGDQRSRDKVDHRGGVRTNKACEFRVATEFNPALDAPQELIDKAAMLGCEIWEIEKYEREQADHDEDSDLSEESKRLGNPRNTKANMAAAAREMPPDSSSEEEGPVTEQIVEETKEEEESDDGD